ncbi:MAG: polysaccharide deacetylase family sporulation protein PdaB [Chitinophagales bacterium]
MKLKVVGFYHLNTKAKVALLSLAVVVFIITSMVYVEAYHKLKPVYDVPCNEKVVALTFDISWGNQTPLPVIDILEKNDIQCTFFLSGPWAKQYPEVVKRIKGDGHEIASHGYRHINLSTLSRGEIKDEIMKAHEALKGVSGVKPNLIRTPNGDYNDEVIMAAGECNYQVIQWSVDSLDWMNPGPATITERVTNRVKPGSIILMHASDTCKQTTDALPDIIKNLKDQGYKFVTVSELMEKSKEKNK